MSDLPDAVDVVVVGAGLAGLNAARTVAAAGRSVLVCEASDDVGGRVRTDVVDGFLVDRGFQILNTYYPALRAAVDLAALDLRRFEPGAAVRTEDGGLRRVARTPPGLARAAVTRLLGLRGKLGIAAFSARSVLVGPQRLARAAARSAAADLARFGIPAADVDRFVRPFLSGVLGDADLATSSRVVSLFWRTFALGDLTLPSRGIGAMTAHVAARLPAGTVALDTPVREVAPGSVTTDAGTVRAGAVVVATEGTDAAGLLGTRVEAPRTFALTSHYHVTDQPPTRRGLLHLDGTGGPVVNTMVLTAAAPSYSPDHRHLVVSTVLGAEALPEPRLRAELERIWGVGTAHWEHLATRRIPHALPAALPPTPPGLRRPVDLGDGLFVAGDHRDSPSVQGALVSGRRTAQAALARLG